MATSNSTRPRAPHTLLFLAALGLTLGAIGCTSKMKSTVGGGPTGGPPPAATVNIVPSAATKGMMAFSPDTVTVHVNDTVRMHNGDSIVHDIEPVTPGNPGWGVLSGGQNVDTPFPAVGTFTYACAVPGHVMIGTVIVGP